MFYGRPWDGVSIPEPYAASITGCHETCGLQVQFNVYYLDSNSRLQARDLQIISLIMPFSICATYRSNLGRSRSGKIQAVQKVMKAKKSPLKSQDFNGLCVSPTKKMQFPRLCRSKSEPSAAGPIWKRRPCFTPHDTFPGRISCNTRTRTGRR